MNEKEKCSMTVQDEKGFTLVETIIAIAIITIIAAMFSNFLAVALKARTLSRERLQLLAYATSKLDEITAIQNYWQNIEGLQGWLINDGFSDAGNGVFIKEQTDINNINYNFEISIDENTGIDGIFQLNFSIESGSGNRLFFVLRLREVE
ncbi:MAG: prepilin-type N-terminal cleavage/methylation domain-containing protein [Firmicutes bacterium]|nr:prepilin-type N-terminal cleavage/methylation domain-containing protein [Bacillota bacterium]